MKINNFLTSKTFVKLFFVLSFIFLFLNLGNIYLWHDEVSTALVGRNIAEFGYPVSYDGKNWLLGSFQSDAELTGTAENFNEGLVWTSHTWLPYYVSALSFKLFGYSNFSARLFFALIGFAALFLVYKLYTMLYKDKKIISLALIILFASTYFFTFSRQCRYYSPILFFTIGVIINYINILKRDKTKDIVLFSICGALLFHSHYLSFFVAFLTLTIHFLFFTKFKAKIKDMAFSYIIIALLSLPWFLYAQPWKIGADSGAFNLSNVLTGFLFLLKSVNYHYPLIILALLPLLLYKSNKTTNKDNLFSDRLLFIFILIPILFMALFSPVKIYRYIFGFSSLFFLFCSRVFYIFWKKENITKIISFVVLALLLTSNLLPIVALSAVGAVSESPLTNLCVQFAPDSKKSVCEEYINSAFNAGNVKFPIFYYMYELTHDYNGPEEGVVKYLNENAKSNDIVWAYFSGYYAQFYADLKVMDPQEYNQYLNDSSVKPDWVVYRRKRGDLAQSLVDYVKNNSYIPIEINYPDIYYENKPDMVGHRFWTAKEEPNLIIYKKPI